VDEEPVHANIVPGPEMNLAQCKNVLGERKRDTSD